MRRLKIRISKRRSWKTEKQRHTCDRVRERSCQTRPVWPANSTWPYLSIPATPSVKLGTNLKLEDRPSYPSRHCRWKPTGSPPLEAWKPVAPIVFVAIDSIGFWWRNWLGFVPHSALCHFWLSTAARYIVLSLISRWKTYGFGSSIRSHRRTWEVTTATIGLSVAITFRLELLGQRWLNSGDHWSARAFR